MVQNIAYPVARRDDEIVEDLHGQQVVMELFNKTRMICLLDQKQLEYYQIYNIYLFKVTDPYRWLEDPDSAETQEFVEQQNKVTQPYLEDCEEWAKINKKLTTLWNYPKYSVPDRHGDYYFSYMNTGLQNQK